MSSTAITRPPGGPDQAPAPMSGKDQQKARALGVTSATGLVIGSIVGTGVFTMPGCAGGGWHQFADHPRGDRARSDGARRPVRPADPKSAELRWRAVCVRPA